ncbi:hypothetical protein L210DRAFT_370235 [Boletus edulis BED1]|uniref:Uncharacterized protein n=1 Tax=Boletus edulis BED1 TaxID=1328754 RepID=A0AAD4BV49_BOLED|nr:hypothetical protein L210DRAFT_370235 [Boletus edulis BED1]
MCIFILGEDLGEDFAMETWPVAPRCTDVLEKNLPAHDLCPLPAYDKKGRLIPPTQDDSMLKGATVEVHFAFIHYEQPTHIHGDGPKASNLTLPWSNTHESFQAPKGKGHEI